MHETQMKAHGQGETITTRYVLDGIEAEEINQCKSSHGVACVQGNDYYHFYYYYYVMKKNGSVISQFYDVGYFLGVTICNMLALFM